MDQVFMPNESPEEREKLLRDSADGIETKSYMRRYTPEELQEQKDVLAESSIALHGIAQRKAEAVKEFSEEAKPFNEQKTQALKALKEKSELIEEPCFKIIYQEERMTAFYNKRGELVDARPSMADELGGTIFTPLRKAQ